MYNVVQHVFYMQKLKAIAMCCDNNVLRGPKNHIYESTDIFRSLDLIISLHFVDKYRQTI